jgi:beta-glucosidase
MTGAISTAFSYQITATNVPTSFSATGLPAGLTLNATTGVISGSPSASGNFNVTLRATNALGQGPAAVMSLGISSTPDTNLALNQPTQTSSVQGTAVGSRAVDSSTTTNWESQYSDPQWIYVDLGASRTIHSIVLNWQNSAGKDYKLQVSDNTSNWNDVVTVIGNNTTGVITYSGLNATGRYVRMYGTARKTAYGYNMFDFQVWGQGGVAPPQPPVINSPSSATGTVGVPFSYQTTATNNPTSFAISGSLPSGWVFGTTTGLLTGTPSAAGPLSFTLTASNSAGTSPNFPLTVTISPASAVPVVNSPQTATGTVGVPFNYQITATNSPTSYGLTGTLPAGLTFSSSTGAITGTPTGAQNTSHQMTAANSSGTSAQVPLGITINPASGDTNIAQGVAAVTASSVQAGNAIANANDGVTTTRWAAVNNIYPQWWMVDFGSNKTLSRVDIPWYSSASRAYKYKIETSTDGTNFNTPIDRTTNATFGDTSDSFTATARFVRITVTGCTTTSGQASAYEFKIFGH